MTGTRFGGIARLYSETALDQLSRARVCVVGLGGVGSWTVEALARSGVGRLTLIDADDICETNINRQLHALGSTIGQSKARVLAARVKDIHPGCEAIPVETFFHLSTAEELLAPGFDLVIDAVDRVMAKVCLLGQCRERGLPAVTCGGIGGRTDPFAFARADLAETGDDPLLAYVRKKLRRVYNFPSPGTPFGVPCVFSREPIRWPGECDVEPDEVRSCDTGIGAAAHVTGVVGLMLAGLAIEHLVGVASGSPR